LNLISIRSRNPELRAQGIAKMYKYAWVSLILPDSVFGMKIFQQLSGRKSVLRKNTHAIENGSLAAVDQFKGNLDIKHILWSSE
jgi:hypothetical protein